MIDDYVKDIDNIRIETIENSKKIEEKFASRNMRGGHNIEAQKKHVIKSKLKAEERYARLARDIEDILVENFQTRNIDSVSELKEENRRLDIQKQELKKMYKQFEEIPKTCDILINGGISDATKNFKL